MMEPAKEIRFSVCNVCDQESFKGLRRTPEEGYGVCTAGEREPARIAPHDGKGSGW